jgi:hypothetical protein
MIGYRDMDDPATVVCEDHEDKEQPKSGRGHHEQVRSHDLVRVIGEEGPPRLGRWSSLPPHVFGDGRLTH